MTTPNLPDEPGFWLKMIFEELRGINGKLDGHSDRLTSLEMRQDALAKDLHEHEMAVDELKKTRTSWRQVALTVAVALVVGFIPVLFHI